MACDIEINRLGEPVGKQDQYIAAVGGITAFTFHPDGRVEYRPCAISEETLFNLEDNLLLFFTGYSRSASSILKEQDVRSRESDQEMVNNLHYVKYLGFQSKEALEADKKAFAALMQHVKTVDAINQTVIMVQVENEPGEWGGVRDFGPDAQKAFAGQVPEKLVRGLGKKPGTWREVFGDDADETFHAWYVATYIEQVAVAGKAAV
jgi:hypothetical protein